MRKLDRPLVVILTLSLIVLPARRASAWINTGHKVVAFVAWEDLTPKTRDAITAALKQHPRYKEDLLEGVADDVTGADRDRAAFANAAIWPDTVKQMGNPMRVEFNHPGWHYTDIPFDLDNTPLPADATTGSGEPHDILTALPAEAAVLKDPAASPVDKAVAVCWLAHLVGDIHQPLHCASEFSHEFPRGDQGGNLEIVLRDPPYTDSRMNLHLVWDELPGDFASDALDRYEALGLRGDPRYSREALKDQLAVTDFAAWAKESYALAVKDAYLDGKLKSAVAQGRGQVARGLPPGYLANAEHVAMKQVTLGGYRLADLLNSILDPK
jgi:hypothetical protein